MRTTRTLVAALATISLAAPAAQAMPTDMHSPQAHAATTVQKRQDLRSADARDAAVNPSVHAVNAPGATAADSASVVGPAPARSVTVTPADDGGVDWTTIAIGIAGSLIAVGGIGLMLNRRNRSTPRYRAAV